VVVIVALNRAGVIPAEEVQDMGQVLREVQLTATQCTAENKGGQKAIRGWPQSWKGERGNQKYSDNSGSYWKVELGVGGW